MFLSGISIGGGWSLKTFLLSLSIHCQYGWTPSGRRKIEPMATGCANFISRQFSAAFVLCNQKLAF